MSKYDVTAGGKRFTVTVPDEMTFKPPATDAQAVEALAIPIATQLLPHVAPIPVHKTLERNEAGQLSGITEYPAATVPEVAMQIGREIARRHLGLD